MVAELYTGIFCMPYDKRQIELQNNLSEMLQEELPESILPFDIGCAMQHAELMGTNRRRGIAISIPDNQIAATCLHYVATSSTRNTKDFIHSGVTLVDAWLISNNTRHPHKNAV